MPAGKNSNNSRQFTNIKKGKIHIYQGKGQEDRIEDYVEGKLVDLNIVKDTYDGKEYDKLELTIDDGAETFLLGLRLDSAYGRAIASCLPNADLSKWIKFTPSYKDEKAGMFLNHGRDSIKWAFTKDNLNGMPPLKVVNFRGKDQYDNADQIAFFKDLLLNKIKPKLQGASVIDGPASYTENESVTTTDDDNSGLPF